jgi:hypothetical protein
MADFKLEVDDIEGVTRKMLNSGFVIRQFQKANESTAKALHQRVTTYPPARPSSTYTRTGVLKGGWNSTTRETALITPDLYRVPPDRRVCTAVDGQRLPTYYESKGKKSLAFTRLRSEI